MNNKNYLQIKKSLSIWVFLLIHAVIVVSMSFAGGAVEEATISYPVEVHYLSPKNADGVNDVVKLGFTGNITPAKKRKIQEITFNVYDETGEVVFTQTAAFNEVENYTFEGKNKEGEYLSDGQYNYTISVKDDKGNLSTSQPYPIVIDNTPPDILSAKVSSGTIVSHRNNVSTDIEVSGSKEIEWKYFAINENGEETLLFSQESKQVAYPPQVWQWLAVDSTKNELADGLYQIRVNAQDKSGNKNAFTIDDAIIVSQDGAVKIAEVDGLAFSPNDDGSRDTLGVNILFPTSEGISEDLFANWKYVLKDEEGNRVLTKMFEIGEEVQFDGLDVNGYPIADGMYSLAIEFGSNKMNEKNLGFLSNGLKIIIDTEPPQATFALSSAPAPTMAGDPIYFGGDKKDRLTGKFTAHEDIEWRFAYYTESGDGRRKLGEMPVVLDDNRNFYIDVSTDTVVNETPLPDGFYIVDFYAYDAAGNKGGAIGIGVVKDTEGKMLKVGSNKAYVSPTGAPVSFAMEYSPEGIKEFKISIASENGTPVKNVIRKNSGISTADWGGKDDYNNIVADGKYSYAVQVQYYNGDLTKVEGTLEVDSVPPVLTSFKPESGLVNPKDEKAKFRNFVVAQTTDEKEALWRVEIRNIFEQIIYTDDQGTELKNVSWGGKGADGNFVPDGDYVYMLSAVDKAGNRLRRNFSFIVDTGAYDQGKTLSIDGEMPVVFFPAFSEDIFSYGENELLYENLLNIRSVARLLKAYPGYNIKVVGHAAALLGGTSRKEQEQTEVLIPLSRGRAEQIRRALLILGVEETRVTTEAVGGLYPLVEQPTKDNIWQNRRVQFVISER